MSDKDPDTASFGYRQVATGEKQDLVNEVFAKVAERYDQMNDLMSGGLHRLWKDDFVALLSPPKHAQSFAVLDVAGGTGDIARRMKKLGDGAARRRGLEPPEIHVIDINTEMLEAGRARGEAGLNWHEGDAENLPVDDHAADAYIISFGIRNCTDIPAVLREAKRVLKPGGRFYCLEFSRLAIGGLEPVYDFYSFNAIPALGKLLANDADSYRYLVESIRRFPDQETFAAMIREAGFARVAYRNMAGGVCALHWGWSV